MSSMIFLEAPAGEPPPGGALLVRSVFVGLPADLSADQRDTLERALSRLPCRVRVVLTVAHDPHCGDAGHGTLFRHEAADGRRYLVTPQRQARALPRLWGRVSRTDAFETPEAPEDEGRDWGRIWGDGPPWLGYSLRGRRLACPGLWTRHRTVLVEHLDGDLELIDTAWLGAPAPPAGSTAAAPGASLLVSGAVAAARSGAPGAAPRQRAAREVFISH